MLGWKFHPFGWWYFRILWKVVTPLLLLVGSLEIKLANIEILTFKKIL